jgi:hypothetical protein
MYYNQVNQPDGTPIIGINIEEERPRVMNVLPVNEIHQQSEPVYQLFDFIVVSWLSVFMVIISIYFTLEYDNIVSIINCLSCLLPLHSIKHNNVYGIFAYTAYVMFAMVLTTLLGVYEYFWYYISCNAIIICIFITSVVKYYKYIRNQNQNINEHVV